jgi:hypothetical protein
VLFLEYYSIVVLTKKVQLEYVLYCVLDHNIGTVRERVLYYRLQYPGYSYCVEYWSTCSTVAKKGNRFAGSGHGFISNNSM